MNGLKNEMSLSEKKIVDLKMGIPTPRKKKYKFLDQRIKNQLSRYESNKEEINVLEVLIHLSSAIEF